MAPFRTQQEVDRALWAEKRMSVAEGRLYTDQTSSPFPIHEYFKLGLLGKEIKMVEVNAGHAMVENITADTLTDLSVKFYKDSEKKTLDAVLEAEFMQFMKDIEYDETHEQFVRSLYGSGYGVEQPVKQPGEGENEKDLITVVNVDPSTWYPDIPAFSWQKVTSGRIITTFNETDDKGVVKWFAFVERHTIGRVEYELYQINNPDALDGTKVELGAAKRFKGVTETFAETGLDEIAVFQKNRRKPAGYLFGNSILFAVWGVLQEVSEFQTQIRQERIKHFRSKMYAPRESLSRARNVPGTSGSDAEFRSTSKEIRETTGGQNLADASQDVFPIPPGSEPPGYIQWDMSILEAGSKEIDKILSRAAAVSGFPRSVFNLDDKGDIHVETDRRKNKRYVQQVIQGQTRSCAEIRQLAMVWWSWVKKTEGGGEPPVVEVTRAPPFDLSQQEMISMMREQNPNADFISQHEAIRKINPTWTEEQITKMIDEMREESKMLAPANSLLDEPPVVEFPN